MLRSSLGFHTMTLSLFLIGNEIKQLIKDFMEYAKNTGLLIMYRKNENKGYIKYHYSEDLFLIPTDIKIYYKGKDKGIKWTIRNDNWFYNIVYDVEVTINPKILAGINDYLTAATYNDLKVAITNFNHECKKISPLLKHFEDYNIKRIDYCVNFCLDEFVPECTPDLIMNLIKRSNIPSRYKEWTTYDSISHRTKSKPSSFYLVSRSVNINCYSKYMQLQERSRENMENGYPPVPQYIDAAYNTIRFEVQCKPHKTYRLSTKTEKPENKGYNQYESLLSPICCAKVVSDYYNRTIGEGDWYTLQEAIAKIKSHHFNIQKERRLVSALHLVNQCRSIVKAKETYQDSELTVFTRTLHELSDLHINPVTIPKDWDVKHIPNLLQCYFNKHLEICSTIEALATAPDTSLDYQEYIKIFGCPSI